MGINLSDYIKDVNQLFTLEEAENLFIAAGYTKKDQSIEGYEIVSISHEVLERNQRVLSTKHMGKGSDFKMRVKRTQQKLMSLMNADVHGMEKVITTETDLGGAA